MEMRSMADNNVPSAPEAASPTRKCGMDEQIHTKLLFALKAEDRLEATAVERLLNAGVPCDRQILRQMILEVAQIVDIVGDGSDPRRYRRRVLSRPSGR